MRKTNSKQTSKKEYPKKAIHKNHYTQHGIKHWNPK